MNTKIILVILMTTLLCGMVSATTQSDLLNKAIAVYPFDTDYTDAKNSYDLTKVSTIDLTSDYAKFGTGGLNFTGGYLHDNDATAGSPFNFGTGQFAYSFWTKVPVQTTGYYALISKTTAWGTNGFYSTIDVDSWAGAVVYAVGGNANYDLSSVEIDGATWKNVIIQRNSSGYSQIYIDGVLVSTEFRNVGATDVSQNVALYIGARSTDQSSLYGFEMDEVYIFNDSLSPTEINWLQNNQLIAAAPSTSTTVELKSPSNNSINNSGTLAFTYNVSSTGGSIDTCQLYINSSGWSVNVTNNTLLNNSVNNFVISLQDGVYLWNVLCNDSVGNTDWNDVNFTVTIDTVNPAITSSFVLNNSIFWTGANITGQINFTDDNLYSMNVSIDGNLIFSNFSYSGSSLVYNLSQSIGSYSAGLHAITVSACDGHTSKAIKDYVVKTRTDPGAYQNDVQFGFHNGWVNINPEGILGGMTAEKKTDRYNFIYERSILSSKNKAVFYITSNEFIDIVQESKYAAHLVVPKLKKWIDFEIQDGNGKEKYLVERISDKEVKVTITGTKEDDKIIFNSIGDLNCNEATYKWYAVDTILTYDQIVSELATQTITYLINHTGIPGGITTNASLLWNNVVYNNFTKITSPDYDLYSQIIFVPSFVDIVANISAYWNFNLSNSLGTVLLGDFEYFNQTVNKILMDNCSVYTVPAMNFTMFRDDTGGYINASMVGYFRLWQESESIYKEFNLSWGSDYRHQICLFTNSSYSVYAQLEYDSILPGFEPETYYLYNTTFSNVTQFVNMFLTNNGTAVTFTVNDQNDNEVADVYIQVLKYDFGTNSHVITEIIKTDENGQAIGNIIPDIQWYKFILLYNGLPYLETEPVKITSTTKNFRINLLSDYFSFYDIINNVATNIYFTNSTKNFGFTFTNPAGTSVNACLNVIKRTPSGDVLVDETCLNAAGGTILVNIGSPTDETYLAVGTIQLNPTFVTETLSVSFDEGYKRWGKDGIFVTFLVRMAFITIGIWNPIIAILLMVLGDIGMVIMGIYQMSWTVLVTYIILALLAMWRVNK